MDNVDDFKSYLEVQRRLMLAVTALTLILGGLLVGTFTISFICLAGVIPCVLCICFLDSRLTKHATEWQKRNIVKNLFILDDKKLLNQLLSFEDAGFPVLPLFRLFQKTKLKCQYEQYLLACMNKLQKITSNEIAADSAKIKAHSRIKRIESLPTFQQIVSTGLQKEDIWHVRGVVPEGVESDHAVLEEIASDYADLDRLK